MEHRHSYLIKRKPVLLTKTKLVICCFSTILAKIFRTGLAKKIGSRQFQFHSAKANASVILHTQTTLFAGVRVSAWQNIFDNLVETLAKLMYPR